MSEIYNYSSLKPNQHTLSNCIIKSDNGKMFINNGSISSCFLQCEEGDEITATGTFNTNAGAFYNSSFAYISGISGSGTSLSITAPANSKYFRISCTNTTNGLIINKVKNSGYEDKDVKETLIFDTSTNELATKDGCTINDSNGTEYTVAGYSCLVDYLEINASTTYHFIGGSANLFLAYFDSSKKYISGVKWSPGEPITTSPANASYTKFGWKNTDGMKMYKVELVNAGATTSYTITNNLTNVTNSNSNASVTDGSSYSGSLTTKPGYTLESVNITMGGSDITSSCYSDGAINIPAVNGDIVITATAVKNETGKTLTSITATYNQGSTTIYPSTSLDSLKTNLTVTANYSDDSTSTISSSNYSLSGTLNVGTSIITVTYSGKTTTFNVTVSEEVTPTVNIVLSSTSLSVNESSSTIFTVKLDKQPSSNITVALSVNNSNCTINKSSLTFTSSNYSIGQEITVSGTHNSSSYSNLNSTITLSAAGLTTKTVNVTIVNIDENPEIKTSEDLSPIEYVRQGVKTLIFDSNSNFNFIQTLKDYYVVVENGLFSPTPGVTSTYFIPINEGDVIYFETNPGNFPNHFLAFYDDNKAYLSGVSGNKLNTTSLTVEASQKYFRVCYSTNNNFKIYITKSNSLNPSKGVYLDPNKIIYNGITLKDLLNKYDYSKNSKWHNKKWGLIGDSLTECNARTTANYHHFICNQIHCKQCNVGCSGYGFKEMVAKVDLLDSDIDFITIFGGINNYMGAKDKQELGNLTDTSSSSTVTGQLRKLIEYVLNKFPYIPIGFITPIPEKSGNSISKTVNTQGYTLEQLVDRIKEVCSEYSIPVLDLYRNSGLRPWNTDVNLKYFSSPLNRNGDGLHPNQLGHELFLAPKILKFIETL